MNAALNRPAMNTTILVSVIFHLAVLYYLATTWNILPPLIHQPDEHPAVQVVLPPPPPPIVKPDEKPPFVAPHHLDTVRQTDIPPVPLPTSFVKPIYPATALAGEREGRVRLSITILPDGSVTDVQVVSAQPAGLFEQSAVDAVKRWHYAPSAAARLHVYVDVEYQLTG